MRVDNQREYVLRRWTNQFKETAHALSELNIIGFFDGTFEQCDHDINTVMINVQEMERILGFLSRELRNIKNEADLFTEVTP